MAIWAMQAGKDVYVEKPVSHNVSEGRRIVEAARKYKRICQTGTQSRSNPGMIAGHRVRAVGQDRRGEAGPRPVLQARGRRSARRAMTAIPAHIDYDLWCGPAPLKPSTRNNPQNGPVHYDWHWIWDYGNGDLGNQGIHQMDMARWGLGVKELCARRRSATAAGSATTTPARRPTRRSSFTTTATSRWSSRSAA